jgi:transposase
MAMVSIERERDPEVLRQVDKLLDHENKRLHEKLRAAIEENLKLKNADPSKLQLELLRLQELVNKQRHAIFGDSSERSPAGPASQGAPKARRGHGPTEQPLLPIEQVVHELDTAERHCPSCGGELCEMEGQFEESELVHVVERHFKVVTHQRKKYRCACNAHIQTAPGPNKLIAGGRYAVDFAIEVALQKYLEHMPLERQVKSMRRDGLVVTTQTLWDQLVALAKRLGSEALMDRMLRYLLSKAVLGADETVWRLLDKKGKQAGSSKWYAWSVCGDDAVYYLISETRGSSTAAELLGGYHGTVVTDGYYVYQRLRDQPGTDFRLAFCWSHVRRGFLEASPSYREARAVVALIDELFAVERARFFASDRAARRPR